MNIIAGGKTITATLADNATAKALAEKLKSGSVTVEMKAFFGSSSISVTYSLKQ